MKRLMAIITFSAAIGFAGSATYAYDSAGHLTKVVYSSGTTITYTYDKAGNLVTRTVSSSIAAASTGQQASWQDYLAECIWYVPSTVSPPSTTMASPVVDAASAAK
jgi:YD repeat-containing protein